MNNKAEFGKLLTRYSSNIECPSEQCHVEHNVREHYHCFDVQCAGKSLHKKEEIIRHLKWHKKRQESLNHGFLRFSSSDDCTKQFPDVVPKCQHNRKQTHYHCLRGNCDKIYISTSDVQMHSNYHRKDSAIIQEGFQRFRATEECLVSYCSFYGQRTTHFHCRRDNCKFTFKNKADMEKHKTYHIKDEQLVRDGFKKFFKNESCSFNNCRFSSICNHIHCVRDNCEYVLHSSSQLLSHKRKHERLDTETAYRLHKMSKTSTTTPSSTRTSTQTPDIIMSDSSSPCDLSTTNRNYRKQNQLEQKHLYISTESLQQLDENEYNQSQRQNNDTQLDFIKYFTDFCTKQKLQLSNSMNRCIDYENKKQLIECHLVKQSNNDANKGNEQLHVHCLIKDCKMILDKNFKAMEDHFQLHARTHFISNLNNSDENYANRQLAHVDDVLHYSNGEAEDSGGMNEEIYDNPNNLLQITSIDGFFNRKRGRPPKNRVVEVYNKAQLSPQAIFTSFKLQKNDKTGDQTSNNAPPHQQTIVTGRGQSPINLKSNINDKVHIQLADKDCIYDRECKYNHELHFHCNYVNNCFFITNNHEFMIDHLEQFHTNAKKNDELDNNDLSYNCRVKNCTLNKTILHYHCKKCNTIIGNQNDIIYHNCKAIKQEMITGKKNDNPSDTETLNDGHIIASNRSKKDVILTNKNTNVKKNDNNNNHDVDKISVVRAVGTFFPANSDMDIEQVAHVNQTSYNYDKPITAAKVSPISYPNDEVKLCQRAFCKLKKKAHKHCDLCNQAFSDEMKLKIHCMKHRTTKLGHVKFEHGSKSNSTENLTHQQNALTASHHDILLQTAITHAKLPKPHQQTMKPPYFSVDDLQLAQLSFYQSNPYYLHPNIYPFINAANKLKSQGNSCVSGVEHGGLNLPDISSAIFNANEHFLHHHLKPQYKDNNKPSNDELLNASQNTTKCVPSNVITNSTTNKRKLVLNSEQVNKKMFKTDSIDNDNSSLNYDSIKFTSLAAENRSKKQQDTAKTQTQTNLKMFKDEPIPTGYLKFRFNEDCNFTNCGYRNHQSHFHCCRVDCYYSFCDKTRFVQHTARHERLDKLMGDDFRQYRASMKCGYDACVYNKNLGPNNKSSHFHCLKCNYICSDTNKVVAHRRQHNKMEYIRMAGFRKVANNEKCSSDFRTNGTKTIMKMSEDNETDEEYDEYKPISISSVGTSKTSTELSPTINVSIPNTSMSNIEECSYSLKQTHYHCLVCDVAVLSRAQLTSHRHRV